MTLDEFVYGEEYAKGIKNNIGLDRNGAVYSYDTKITVSGRVVEVAHYEQKQFAGASVSPNAGRRSNYVSENYDDNREISLVRARKRIRNLINANAGLSNERLKFMTLTFKECILEVDESNKHFKDFIKRLNYYCNKLLSHDDLKKSFLKYTAVLERQEERGKKEGNIGSIHYHVVFYNLPYVPHSDLVTLWGLGSVNIKELKDIDNVGAYICKYITKQSAETFKGKKIYMCSKGLEQPFSVTRSVKVDRYLKLLDNFVCKINNSYNSEYTGKVDYKQFVIDFNFLRNKNSEFKIFVDYFNALVYSDYVDNSRKLTLRENIKNKGVCLCQQAQMKEKLQSSLQDKHMLQIFKKRNLKKTVIPSNGQLSLFMM